MGGAGWRLVRRHWFFAFLLAGGVGLRVLATVAYRPALLYIDSSKYLDGVTGTAPQGYRALLRLLDPVGGFALVAAVQHLFGLAMGVALYALLRRRGAPRWVAALAAAPVLLDAYQLQLEQTIMPDVLFETMITAGLVLLLWRPAASARLVAAGALVLGAAATVREIGAVLVVPAVVFAAAGAGAGWRRRAGRAALAAGCFALPVLAYMTGAYLSGEHFGLGSNGPGPEYGRAAAAADCATLVVPADERALCPSPAQTLALGGIDGLLHSPASPGHTVPVPPGVTRGELLDRFALAVVRQQPDRVAWSVVAGLGPALRAHPGRQPAGHPDHALAVPDLLPGLPAPVLAGLLHPARAAEQQRRRPGGGPAGRRHPARLPARRRLHPRAAVRGLPGCRGARRRAGPAAGRAGPGRGPGWPGPACWSRWRP